MAPVSLAPPAGPRTAGLLLATLLVLPGCARPGADPAADPGGAFPRTVTHAMGVTEIPAVPRRIVALDQTFVDAALALDMPTVAFTDIRGRTGAPPPYLAGPLGRIAPDARSVGPLANPSLEQIAALRPDLIVSAQDHHADIYDELSRIAPTVFSATTGATWKDNLRLLGVALGDEALAEQRLAEYERRAAAVGDAIRAAVGANPTVSVIRFSSTQTRLYQRASFSGIVLADAGLARPPAQDVAELATEFSEERILDADADQIFVTVADGDAQGIRDRYVANPLWARLGGRVIEVDNDVWIAAVGLLGAHAVLDDLAAAFAVDPAR